MTRYNVVFIFSGKSFTLWCKTEKEAVDIRDNIIDGIKNSTGNRHFYRNGDTIINIDQVNQIYIEKESGLERGFKRGIDIITNIILDITVIACLVVAVIFLWGLVK